MPRYIDADKLIDKIFPIGLIDNGNYGINAKAVKVVIDRTPTADVAEVVRCKDCIYWENGKDYTPYCNNIDGLNEPSENDFCSYGERKEK